MILGQGLKGGGLFLLEAEVLRTHNVLHRDHILCHRLRGLQGEQDLLVQGVRECLQFGRRHEFVLGLPVMVVLPVASPLSFILDVSDRAPLRFLL